MHLLQNGSRKRLGDKELVLVVSPQGQQLKHSRLVLLTLLLALALGGLGANLLVVLLEGSKIFACL